VTIDPKTKRIVRKKTCVPYVAIPVLVKVARIISEKGGVLVSNDVGGPRSIWKEDIITSCETGGGDARPVGGLHLGRTVTPLGNPMAIQNGRDIYRDILTKLDLGALYFWYGDYDRLKYKTLVEQMYPITFDSIHGGTVRGLERIVTKKSGVYGWKGDRSLHCVYRYDARGALTRSDCLTTVDKAGVRTQVNLAEAQSAAVVKIPCRLTASAPVNVCVNRYDESMVSLELNGKGKATLTLTTGDFTVKDDRKYRVTIGGKTTDLMPKAGELRVELSLQGPVIVNIALPEAVHRGLSG
ncbi:MAG: hypothetical protein HY318_06725, partial [Armatimonadetes bacterium]|nr:hypothetical protein [Armatimonadota bacterium]